MEFTADAIEGLIQHSEQELAEAEGKRFIRPVEEMRAWDYQQMNEKLWQFLDKLVENVTINHPWPDKTLSGHRARQLPDGAALIRPKS